MKIRDTIEVIVVVTLVLVISYICLIIGGIISW